METHLLIDAVHKHFGVNPSLRTRRREVVDARSAVMVALRQMHTMQEIASMFTFPQTKNGVTVIKTMSHCTVLHCLKQHEDKYHPDEEKRMYSYKFYCEVYDFAREFLGNPKFRPVSTIQLREDIIRERIMRREVEREFQIYRLEKMDEIQEMEKILKKTKRELEKLTKERDHIKRAFTQLYLEKKARDEKANAKIRS